MKHTLSRVLLQLSLSILIAGCSSTTILHSVPSGAKLYVNDEYRGTTPYVYRDQKIVGSSTAIRLSLVGYKDLNTVLQRDERLHVGALVGGFFFVVPWLWVMQYERSHTWELQPLAERTSDISPQPQPLTELLKYGLSGSEEYNPVDGHAR